MPLDDSPAATADAPWPEIDRGLFHGSRPAPPPFPLELLPDRWRAGVEGCAPSFTSVDYIAQGLLGAVSAVCGARVVVDVTRHWREPLVLWQAMVGAPSTGKTPALAAARRLVDRAVPKPERLLPNLPADGATHLLVRTSFVHPRGVALWCDDLAGWLTDLSHRQDRAMASAGWSADYVSLSDVGKRYMGIDVPRFALGILATLQADRLTEVLRDGDDGAASRFLYSWPVPRLETSLSAESEDPEGVHALLRRVAAVPGAPDAPHALALEPAAVEALEALVPLLRSFMRDTDGLESAWVGKGPGNIVRLAGLLCLMDWAQQGTTQPPALVEQRHVEQAHALWTGYFWPHAQAVFGRAGTTLADRRTRQIANWLRRLRSDVVSREEVRREGLSQSVDAGTTEELIERLERHGVLRPLPAKGGSGGGPRKRRWEVNPALWAS
jgi:hypothetical protein